MSHEDQERSGGISVGQQGLEATDQAGGAWCGGCGSNVPLSVGLNDAALNMDWAIAHEVFGVPESVLPRISCCLRIRQTDRHAAFRAMDKVASKGGEVRAHLDKLLTDVPAKAV